MIKENDIYAIGKIGKPHGVKGEMSFMFVDDIFDRIEAQYLILKVDGIFVPFFLEEYRFKSDDVALIKFLDIDTEAQAKELTGCEVYFPRQQDDENNEATSWAELVSYHLYDVKTKQDVGEIMRIDDSTINLLFEVKSDSGELLLIPAAEQLIEDIDKKHHIIYIKVPQGLLEL